MEFINLGSGIVNAYLIPLEDGYAMIDTGYPHEWKGFLKRAKKAGISLDKIKYIVITHIHADHVGFLKKLMNASGATLIYDSRDADRLKSGANVEDVYISSKFNLFTSRISVAFRKFTQLFESVETDRFIDYAEQPLKGYGCELLSLSGHTSHDLCLIYDDIIFCGDVAMNGTGAVNHSPMWIENNEELCNSWEKLIALDKKYLYPAHGKPFDIAELKTALKTQRTMTIYKLKK